MNNLLIVDDEIEILEWLKELFTYECKLELDVYAADSGRRAMEFLSEIPFDVVLTDIKMPGMDGITLFKKIKENWPNCKVVFLTGHREFDYVYEVIQHKDVRYVLKSEGDQVIMDNVSAAFEDIARMLEQEQTQSETNSKLEKAASWLREDFFRRLIDGTEQEQIRQRQLDELNIPLCAEVPVMVFLCRVNNIRMQDDVINEYNIFEKVFEMVTYYTPKQIQIFAQITEPGYALLFMQPVKVKDNINWEHIYRISMGALDYVQKNCENVLGHSTLFAVSGKSVKLKELGGQYEKLKKMAVNQNRSDISQIIKEEKIEKQEVPETGGVFQDWYTELLTHIQLLESYLELRKKEEYFQILEELCNKLTIGTSKHSGYFLECYYSISMVILRFINRNNLSDKIAFKIGVYKLTRVEEHADWEDAARYLISISKVIFELLEHDEAERNNHMIKLVQEYIGAHMDEELTLTKLSEIGCFNASYLSRLFKSVYGYNISEYILKVRIERAKELLIGSEKKIQEISEKVGYLSAHSFARAFKGAMGISPGEFRERYGKRQ